MKMLPACPECKARVLDGEAHAPVCGLALAWYQRRCAHDFRPAGGLIRCEICGYVPTDEELDRLDQERDVLLRAVDEILRDAGLDPKSDLSLMMGLKSRILTLIDGEDR